MPAQLLYCWDFEGKQLQNSTDLRPEKAADHKQSISSHILSHPECWNRTAGSVPVKLRPEKAIACIPGFPAAGSLLVWFKKSTMFAYVTLTPLRYLSLNEVKLAKPATQVAGMMPDNPFTVSSLKLVKLVILPQLAGSTKGPCPRKVTLCKVRDCRLGFNFQLSGTPPSAKIALLIAKVCKLENT